MQTAITQAELPLILAIDISMSSIRSLLFDHLGRSLPEATSRQRLKLVMGKDDRADISTASLTESCSHCIDETYEKVGDIADQVAAVAMCKFVSNHLGVDSAYNPVTPVYTYADTRPSKVIPDMRSIFDEEQVHQRTGCVLHVTYLPARFIWLTQYQPELMTQDQPWMTMVNSCTPRR